MPRKVMGIEPEFKLPSPSTGEIVMLNGFLRSFILDCIWNLTVFIYFMGGVQKVRKIFICLSIYSSVSSFSCKLIQSHLSPYDEFHVVNACYMVFTSLYPRRHRICIFDSCFFNDVCS